jgi:hypothetical protein
MGETWKVFMGFFAFVALEVWLLSSIGKTIRKKYQGKKKDICISEKALKLLKKSITKWEAIVYAEAVDWGGADCALCREYLKLDRDLSCRGCPIYMDTGKIRCVETPYAEWAFYMLQNKCTKRKVFDQHSARIALDMLLYLKSLLPPEESKWLNLKIWMSQKLLN